MPAVVAEMAAEEVEEGMIHLKNFHTPIIDDSFKRIFVS